MVDGTAAAGVPLQVVLVGLVVVAVRRRDVAAAVNAVAALALALLPLVLRAVAPGQVSGWAALTAWVAGAGILHTLGMLGLYESRLWWWDHLTHLVSAALLAALLYAALLVAPPEVAGLESTAWTVPAVTLAFTVVVGVFWELIELAAREVGDRFDVEPVLVHYGWRDTALDLVFDLLGAALVVGADLRLFVPLFDPVPTVTGGLLVGAAWLTVGGSVLLGVVVWRRRSWRV